MLCDKHKFTMVFYERGKNSKNEGLLEIKDQEFLDELREDFIKNYSAYGTLTPLITGSVVKKPHS
jgi:hypothetical protein